MTTTTIKRFKNPMGSVGLTEYRLVGGPRREYDTLAVSRHGLFVSFSGTWGHRLIRKAAADQLRAWRRLVKNTSEA